MKNHKKGSMLTALATMIYSALFIGGTLAYAAENETEPVSDQEYYCDKVVYAGDDDGFPDKGTIPNGNDHFGWKLGKFVVSGFTRVNDESSENPIFLKNVGDEVKLTFRLDQNIDALNGDDSLAINDDKGYDEHFGITGTKLGRGALIVRKKDYQNNYGEPQLYTNYLAGVSKGAETKVQLFEEGDYEVKLDYSVEKTSLKVITTEEDYQITFNFSVRNGNCMVYPFDVTTGQELTNMASTPNGFYLDLAKSRYLDIDISKQNINQRKDDLIEDTRFNKPARDGEKFTDEGIYNIIVKNRYTGSQTEKKIYVGSDPVLQAVAANPSYKYAEVKSMIEAGEQINPDGTFVSATAEAKSTQIGSPEEQTEDKPTSKKKTILITAGITVAVVIVLGAVRNRLKRRMWR